MKTNTKYYFSDHKLYTEQYNTFMLQKLQGRIPVRVWNTTGVDSSVTSKEVAVLPFF